MSSHMTALTLNCPRAMRLVTPVLVALQPAHVFILLLETFLEIAQGTTCASALSPRLS